MASVEVTVHQDALAVSVVVTGPELLLNSSKQQLKALLDSRFAMARESLEKRIRNNGQRDAESN